MPAPYPTYPTSSQGGGGYGAKVNFNTPGSNQNLYAALLQDTTNQSAKVVPGTQFAAQYDFDPVLARIQAMSSMTVANAQAEAAALRKQALIDAGDPTIAQSVGADQNTIDAAKANTLSTEARLQRDIAERARMSDEALNQQNLFYSGARVQNLQQQQQGALEARTDFGARLRALLQSITTTLAQRQAQAIADQAAAGGGYGGYGGYGGGGGDGGGGTPPPAPPPGSPPPDNTVYQAGAPDTPPPAAALAPYVIYTAPPPTGGGFGDIDAVQPGPAITRAPAVDLLLQLARDQRLGF